MKSDLLSDEDIRWARTDPTFRQQVLTENLGRLLEALKRMRREGQRNSAHCPANSGTRRSCGEARRPAAAVRQSGPAGSLTGPCAPACVLDKKPYNLPTPSILVGS
jgi:predicted Fe-S protein YdhL (DUF1289 family)